MDAGVNEAGDGGAQEKRVFVSYARDDRPHAQNVIELLEQNGFEVWWDGLIEGGENYLPRIEAALENADCVVALWSKTSISSDWVRDEAESGRDRGRLVPLSLDGSQPPLGFRQYQTIDVSGWSGTSGSSEAEQIVNAVRAQCGASTGRISHTPARRQGLLVSRRKLALGGAAVVGVAALAGLGLERFGSSSAKAMSLAVMPFSNLSGDPEQIWFSNGLSNELRAALARNPRLRVSAPTSSASGAVEGSDEFAVARQLGVEHILRGSVQIVDNIARISSELMQVSDGLVRWANSFDRQLEDVFAIQTEIAEKVAISLIAEIAGDDEVRRAIGEQAGVGGTDNIAAYEAYLRGHAFYDLSAGEESDRAALAQFDAAIVEDPDYAAAHAMRSTMLAAIANATSQASEVRSLFDRSVSAAEHAIELEPDLAQGHLALGFALSNGRLDPQEAMPHYERAKDLAPGDADAQRAAATFFSYGERIDEAREMIAEVLKLDPLNARAFRSAGFIAYAERDYPGTISRMRQALEFNPKLASAQYSIGNALLLQGDADAAIAAYREEVVPIFALTGEAMAWANKGEKEAGGAAYDALVEQYGDAGLYQQAQVQAQRGNVTAALDLLDRALAGFDPGMLFLPNDPMLDPLRSEARFIRLQSRLSA